MPSHVCHILRIIPVFKITFQFHRLPYVSLHRITLMFCNSQGCHRFFKQISCRSLFDEIAQGSNLHYLIHSLACDSMCSASPHKNQNGVEILNTYMNKCMGLRFRRFSSAAGKTTDMTEIPSPNSDFKLFMLQVTNSNEIHLLYFNLSVDLTYFSNWGKKCRKQSELVKAQFPYMHIHTCKPLEIHVMPFCACAMP